MYLLRYNPNNLYYKPIDERWSLRTTISPKKKGESNEWEGRMVVKKKSRGKGGNPTKLTPQLKNKIIKRIEQGESPRRACINVGLGESRYSAWRSLAEQDKAPYVDFIKAVDQAVECVVAEAECLLRKAFTGIPHVKKKQTFALDENGVMQLVGEVIETTVKVYPQYALVWLERKDRKAWAPPTPAEPVHDTPKTVTAGTTASYNDEWLKHDDATKDTEVREDSE